MTLTNLECKNAKSKEKSYKLAAGRGLYLLVMPNGRKYWRLKYRFNNKEKLMALGVYPEVTLKEADELCTQARKLRDQNIDPMQAKHKEKQNAEISAGNTFELIARQWHENFKHKWSERHAKTVLHRMECDIFPAIGSLPIAEIRRSHLIKALEKVQSRGAYEPAHRLRQYCSQVFDYAILSEIAENNPATLIGKVLKPVVKAHYSCIEPNEIPELLDAIERNDARLHHDTRQAIRLIMLTFVRTKELIEATWDEIDFDEKRWLISGDRMKMKNDHLVPLSDQAIEILKDLKSRNDNWGWVFAGHHSKRKHMSNNTILKGLERLGFKGRMTGHGFRALAMTTIKEKLDYRHEVIDLQLAHKHKSAVNRAYDRSQFIDERTKMMQEWADYIDSVRL